MDQNKQFLLLAIVSIMMVGCRTSKVYYLKAYQTDIKLSLNRDSSFVQEKMITGHSDTFYGRWTTIKDTLFLSISKPEVFFNADSLSTVKEQVLYDKDSIYFEVYYNNDTAAAFAHINLSGREFVTNENGQLNISKKNISETPVSKIEVSTLLTLAHKEYFVKNKASNHFTIALYYKDIFSVKFLRISPPTKYLIKGRKLIYLDIGQGEYYLMRKW